jgi:paraquat-inducible protein B
VSAEYGGQKPLDIKSRAARLVFVRFQVDTSRIGAVPDTATAVSLGLRTRLASQGLTGITYVEVDFADPARYPALQVPWEPTAEYIPSMPSTLTQVQDAAQKLLAMLDRVDLERLVGELSGLLTDLRRELANGDIHTTLNQTTALLRSLDDAVRAADLPSVTGDIKRTSTALRDTVQSEATQKLLTNAAQAAERLNNAAARLPALIAALQATTQRAGNSTADVEQGLGPLLRDLRAASESLREMTESLRRYPGSVLSAPPPREREPAR